MFYRIRQTTSAQCIVPMHRMYAHSTKTSYFLHTTYFRKTVPIHKIPHKPFGVCEGVRFGNKLQSQISAHKLKWVKRISIIMKIIRVKFNVGYLLKLYFTVFFLFNKPRHFSQNKPHYSKKATTIMCCIILGPKTTIFTHCLMCLCTVYLSF